MSAPGAVAALRAARVAAQPKIAGAELGERVGALADRHDEIIEALDMLISGF